MKDRQKTIDDSCDHNWEYLPVLVYGVSYMICSKCTQEKHIMMKEGYVLPTEANKR